MKIPIRRIAAAILVLLLSCTGHGLAITITITDSQSNTVMNTVTVTGTDAREAFIDAIIEKAQTLYEQANGQWQRAEYASDIYVCKNFTVYLFTQNAYRFRMAEFPDVELDIPKLNKEARDGYNKGIEWEDLAASEGNPFYVAAEFWYDADLTLAENEEIARAFMMQVERGDYFQMSANYYWGVGAHSLVFIDDYDPEFQTVHWTDSHMKRKEINGIDYGLVQYDAVKDIDWFVDAFCQPKRGATLYRLRDDIIFSDGQE